MKKTLASILAIMALLGMASCQSNTKSDETATVTVADTTTAVETTVTTAESKETTIETTTSETEETTTTEETESVTIKTPAPVVYYNEETGASCTYYECSSTTYLDILKNLDKNELLLTSALDDFYAKHYDYDGELMAYPPKYLFAADVNNALFLISLYSSETEITNCFTGDVLQIGSRGFNNVQIVFNDNQYYITAWCDLGNRTSQVVYDLTSFAELYGDCIDDEDEIIFSDTFLSYQQMEVVADFTDYTNSSR